VGILASLVAVTFAVPSAASAQSVISLTSCPDVIAVPGGTYRLDADVEFDGVSGIACFEIAAKNVTVLLNGHTISTVPNIRIGSGIIVGPGASGFTVLGPGTVAGTPSGYAHPALDAGIVLGAGKGTVRGVTAIGNDTGILITSSGNDVRGNVVKQKLAGIQASASPAATRNTIIGNYAHNNTLFDLYDGNASCDSNVWPGNDFGTANQSCIH
jgi:hypothetical protein